MLTKNGTPYYLLITMTTPKKSCQQYSSTNVVKYMAGNQVKYQDVVSVSIDTVAGSITIFNIDNDDSHSDSLQAIQDTLEEDSQNLKLINTAKMIWAGDFN